MMIEMQILKRNVFEVIVEILIVLSENDKGTKNLPPYQG